jgi:hypothetical protein
MKGLVVNTQPQDAVLAALNEIDESDFQNGRAGWKGEISTALLDAVFSIRARYESSTPGKGVLGRVESFRRTHEDRRDDLKALLELGENRISEIMGATQTSGKPKSQAVVEAAQALEKIGVNEASDLTETKVTEAKAAYTGVHGLGWITFEYFLMLLGKPGIKADTMVQRFVNDALSAEGLDEVDAKTAHQMLTDIFEEYNQDHWKNLSNFDHAIWRYQRRR